MSYKKVFQVLAVFGVFFLMGAGSVWAVPVTYNVPDNVVYWPGYPFMPAYDMLGTGPIVENMFITADNGSLLEVKLAVQNRRIFDSLFINNNWNGTLADYQSWDYYVRDNGSGPTLYKVNNFDPASDYTKPTLADGGRIGHPSGIIAAALTAPSLGESISLFSYDGTWLIYDFSNLHVSTPFVIGYSQVCANDVQLAFVPEPITMFLLGLGLVGLAGIRRRIL